MSNEIPFESREAVRLRDIVCVRCGLYGTDWHHRRPRRTGAYRHSPMNGVLLCRKDHEWAHKNPLAATAAGYVISTSMPSERVWTVPIKTFRGWLLLMPNATVRFVNSYTSTTYDLPPVEHALDWARDYLTTLIALEGDPLG